MKIISKFHDYYDSIQSYGVDKSIVYKRVKDTKDLNVKQHRKVEQIFENKIRVNKSPALNYEIDLFVVGFCGKLYPAYKFIEYKDSSQDKIKKIRYFYNEESINKFYKSLGKKRYLNYIKENKRTYYKDCFVPKKVEEFFNKNSGIDYPDIFLEFNTPVLFITEKIPFKESWKIEINPCLKDLKFMKVINTYLAYQEIASFISGVLGVGEPEIIELSNEDKIKKKGFHNMSFKKRKQAPIV